MIYFDNSATTRPCNEVIEAIASNLGSADLFGNPGSLHKLGTAADKAYNRAFERAASCLGCDKTELYFTSCGTEGSNTAIRGFAHRNKRIGNTIISTRTEHKATLEVLKLLESEGYVIKYVPVLSDGKPDLDQLSEMIDDDTMLLCFTHVNNETGSILPLDQIVKIKNSRKRDAAIFLDCVQSLGKLDIDLKRMGVDMATFSGHKIHSVKGVGMMWIRNGVRIDPLILGGGQQKNMRSGTQSLVLAEAMVTALEAACAARAEAYDRISGINSYLRRELKSRGAIVLSPEDALPFVLNVSFDGFESETMLHCLEIYDIFVSTVSACSSKSKQVSYVLLESGVDRKIAANSIRLSFCRDNTMEEAEEFIRRIDEIYDLYLVKR